MATTGYKSTGAYLDTGYGIVRIHGEIVYSWSRSNNTVSFTGTYARIKYVRESGGWTSFNYPGWTWKLYTPSGTHRRTNSASGTRYPNDTNNGTSNSFSVNVGANDTSISARVGAYFSGDGETFASHTLDFGALGAPAGTTYFVSRTDSSLVVRNDVTNWGAYATAGSVRSYRAENSGFSGQTYIGTSDNANVTHSGLSPNTRYWFRGWADNGGGKSSYMSTIDATTLASATETSKDVQATTVDFVLAVAQGYRTTTAKVQYRKTGDATWLDSSDGAGGTPTITVSGLLPSTEYEYRYAVTTTDGTWTGSTSTLTTLPAAKIVMPDGTVKSAIPYTISAEGVKEMVKVKVI